MGEIGEELFGRVVVLAAVEVVATAAAGIEVLSGFGVDVAFEAFAASALRTGVLDVFGVEGVFHVMIVLKIGNEGLGFIYLLQLSLKGIINK